MKKAFGLGLATIGLCACGALPDQSESSVGKTSNAIVRGSPETKRPQVVMTYGRKYSGSLIRCTGSYFAPRVILTSASCITNDTKDMFVYYGTNYAADVAQVPNIPAPGQTSVWAKVDSWEKHPQYNATLHDAELAVLYLDRKLPFDPLPLARFNIDASFVGKLGQIVGWGANVALSADISQYSGFGIERSAMVPIVGTPTAADYDPNDPNPGMLNATVRSHYLKLNGQSPNGNACTGDGGGPVIVNQWGQDYIAGSGLWTGLWCENYQIMTRIDPFLPFLDNAYMKGGQATVIPSLDCVVQNADGSLRAQFDYNNQNGVNVSVPYGTANSFPLDTANARPSLFVHGNHIWAFGVVIPKGKTLDWKLSPTNSPTTELKVTANSPRCAATDLRIGCDKFCRAQAAVPACPADTARMLQDVCINECVSTYGIGCDDEWTAYTSCVARLSNTASNWQCYANLADPQPSDSVCVDQSTNLNTCFGF